MELPIVHSKVSSIELEKLLQKFLVHGAVIVRGISSHEDFISFSNRIGTDFVSLESGADKGRIGGGYSGRDSVHGIPSLFSVSGKTFGYAIPLHGELYFQLQQPPKLIWFYCKTPPRHGGQTLFCDGQELFAALPLAIQKRLLSEDLCYIRRLDADIWPEYFGMSDSTQVESYCKLKGVVTSINEDGSMTTKFRSPAVRVKDGVPSFINNLLPFALREIYSPGETRAQVRLASGARIPDEEVLQIEKIAAGLTVSLDWEVGDIAIVDNSRVLHGRTSIDDNVREIFVRLSNADFIDNDS